MGGFKSLKEIFKGKSPNTKKQNVKELKRHLVRVVFILKTSKYLDSEFADEELDCNVDVREEFRIVPVTEKLKPTEYVFATPMTLDTKRLIEGCSVHIWSSRFRVVYHPKERKRRPSPMYVGLPFVGVVIQSPWTPTEYYMNVDIYDFYEKGNENPLYSFQIPQ